MFQKEVADRIVADFNTSNYGRLSILSNWKLDIKKIIDIKPESFSPKPKIDQRMYGKNSPVVVVFKTSNRSNAKTKMKVINKNIDYVLTSKKLPGIPQIAEWLEVGVGRSFIDKYKQKYNLA